MMNISGSILIFIAVILSVLVFIALILWWRGADNVLFPGLGLVVAMPPLIVLLLILNIGFVVFAAYLKPKKDFAHEIKTEEKFEYPNDIFSGCGNGTLTLSLAKNPDEYNENTDRNLKVCINYEDIDSIYDVLFPNRTKYSDQTKNEERQEIENEYEKMRQQFALQYPMIGRIKDIYEDYVFNPEEVKKLREESLKLQAANPNSKADLTFRKLIYACDEASKDNFYLMFSGD